MRKIIAVVFGVIFVLMSFQKTNDPKGNTYEVSVSSEEMALYDLIMEYRKSKKLPKIPLSKSLTYVAQTHCRDLIENLPDSPYRCNGHSWSNKGKWSKCCYTDNHKQASCMWDKPKELTNYTGYGYEIVYQVFGFGDNVKVVADNALTGWKKSKHHNEMIMNKAGWKSMKWSAIGIGIYKGSCCVWFGVEKDVDGEPFKIKS